MNAHPSPPVGVVAAAAAAAHPGGPDALTPGATEPGRAVAWTALEQAVLAVLPQRGRDLARLRVLVEVASPPTVTVIGKFNHGKSRLLNELIGHPVFAVADRRERVALARHDREGLRWLDAPGLDADVGRDDDRETEAAIWVEADLRLFVHAAGEGELDAAERRLLEALGDDASLSLRQTLLVLSRVDEVADDATLAQVVAAIARQIEGLTPLPVSSTRHRQGVDGNKPLLLARSGLPALQAALVEGLAQVPANRRVETARLLDGLSGELEQDLAVLSAQADALGRQQADQREAFDRDLRAVLDQAGADLLHVVDVPGPDVALEPDSFENMFKVTPAKLERARLQVAYSRACIAINAVLTRHGVVNLPTAQRTAVRSLNSVIVAVLGISVKFRADLRRLFCEPAGRPQLLAGFTRYFEQAEAQQALVERIAAAATAIAAVDVALAQVRRWQIRTGPSGREQAAQ